MDGLIDGWITTAASAKDKAPSGPHAHADAAASIIHRQERYYRKAAATTTTTY
jgi:hypothetical protein